MILDEIVASTKIRVDRAKEKISMNSLRSAAEMDASGRQRPSFLKALSVPGLSIIGEVKKASPSKGIIVENFPYMEISSDYETAGVSVISVLTEPEYFQGNDCFLKEIVQQVRIPVLRKDFTVDIYQIYESKLLGASAILLICALFSESKLRNFLEISNSLKLDALVECHDATEIEMALRANADIIGVNNRNLKDFTVDIGNSLRLRPLVPDEKIFVAESGISTPKDTEILMKAKVDAVLVGESLMRAPDKRLMIHALKHGIL